MSAITVGLKNFVYSVLTSDSEVGAVYGEVKSIAGITEASITPSSNSTTHYADDRAYAVATKTGEIEFEVGISDIPTEDQATLLGHHVDANGVLVKGSTDEAPYVAVGFRSDNSDGSEKLVWLLKGKFQVGANSFATQSDSVEFQTKSLSAKFIQRDFDGKWEVSINTGDEGVSAPAITSFFTAVYSPSETPTV